MTNREPTDSPLSLAESLRDSEVCSPHLAAVPSASAAGSEPKTRLRIRFTKCDDLRWISHRDLQRLWERLLRRAGLQLAFSQGFHPKPRISFPSALALGIEALDEVIELEVHGTVELTEIEHLLRREMPQGMELLKLESLQTSFGKAKVLGASYRIAHGLADIAALQELIDDVLSAPVLEIHRDEKKIVCDPRDPYFELKIEGDYFVFSIPNVAAGTVRPSELLARVGLGQLLEDGQTLQRTAVHILEPDCVRSLDSCSSGEVHPPH